MTRAWPAVLKAESIERLLGQPPVPARFVLAAAVAEFGVDRMDLFSCRRESRFIKARAFVVWSLRSLGEPWSYPQIARLLEKSCHSVAINLHMRALALRLSDAKFDAACRRILFAARETAKEMNHVSS